MTDNSQTRNKTFEGIFNRDKILKKLVTSEKPTIFDVGANNGSSLQDFYRLWPDGEFHCFEPQAECWHELEANQTKIGSDRVKIIKAGVAAENNEKAIFYTHPMTSGQSGFLKVNLESKDSILLNSNQRSEIEAANFINNANEARQVPTISLSNYIKSNNLSRVDVLKLDTQGYEAEILSGLGKDVTQFNVILTEIMFFDFYEKSLSFFDVEKHLIPNGFSLFDISFISKNPMNGRTDWVDVIYINNNK